MDWEDVPHTELRNAAGTWVDITTYVRYRRMDYSAFTGRTNEQDSIPAGQLTLGLDNSTGIFTPGVTSAALALMLGMAVRCFDVIGYRRFDTFAGTLEMPDATEQLEGVDTLIQVTAVDRRQLLDNGRTFVSNLAEYVMSMHAGTLRHYYPLNEASAPFRDVVGAGPPIRPNSSVTSSIADSTTAEPQIAYGGGTQIPGDDVRGVQTASTTSSTGGFGFPTMARAWEFRGDFSTGMTSVQFAAGVPLTVILWVAITEPFDTQNIVRFAFGEAGGFTQSTDVALSRVLNHATAAPQRGTLQALMFGTTLTGSVNSTPVYYDTGTAVIPIGVQIQHTPNALTLWVGADEYVATAPIGAALSPQELRFNLTLGDVTGTMAHLQIHVGAFSRTDFLAQFRAGRAGLDGQRTDERIATVLRYAGITAGTVLDEGSTFMQQASLAGKKPGAVIDEAVDTERGRFFVDAAGTPTFHSRVRAYNL